MKTFIDGSIFGDAFLGNRLALLVDLIVDQGDTLLKDAGLSFPSRATSTILLVSKRENLSTADIADELDQPHQLATQRVDSLVKLGLLERRNDPMDARRKTLSLTKKGEKEATILEETLRDAQLAFQGLYQELGVNLGSIATDAILALKQTPITSRIENGANRVNSDIPSQNREREGKQSNA